MSKVTADQVANFLEEEAYRIRTVSFFEQRKSLFNDDFRDNTSEGWAKYLVAKEHTEEDKRMICVIRGEFSVNALYGGRQPVVFDKSVEYYARKMLLRIGGESFTLHFTTTYEKGEGFYFDAWDTDHEQSRKFAEENGRLSEILQDMFCGEKEDFFRDSGPLGQRAEAQLYSQIVGLIEKKNCEEELRRARQIEQAISPSP